METVAYYQQGGDGEGDLGQAPEGGGGLCAGDGVGGDRYLTVKICEKYLISQ